ncbi:MAG: hypothetical protein ACFFEL_16340 [Candidatus Thorarchaeota archaeon]
MVSEALLKWRRKQKRGTIMKPSLFDKIASKAGGGEKGQRIAGAAYWAAARKKYAESKKK